MEINIKSTVLPNVTQCNLVDKYQKYCRNTLRTGDADLRFYITAV